MASNNIQALSDDSFEETIKSNPVVLVDFWAEWCGPCRMLTPTLEKLADEYLEKVVVAKLNVDENRSTASKFGVRSIPTMLLFQGGELKDTLVGALPAPKIKAKLDSYL